LRLAVLPWMSSPLPRSLTWLVSRISRLVRRPQADRRQVSRFRLVLNLRSRTETDPFRDLRTRWGNPAGPSRCRVKTAEDGRPASGARPSLRRAAQPITFAVRVAAANNVRKMLHNNEFDAQRAKDHALSSAWSSRNRLSRLLSLHNHRVADVYRVVVPLRVLGAQADAAVADIVQPQCIDCPRR
jgi:hypothetical protein